MDQRDCLLGQKDGIFDGERERERGGVRNEGIGTHTRGHNGPRGFQRSTHRYV
jgi:hypothetical protein